MLFLLTEPANGQVEQVATPVNPMGQFVVAKGLTIQPFAAQGLLSNPASIDVDDRGRIWIGETVNYRKKARKAGTEY